MRQTPPPTPPPSLSPRSRNVPLLRQSYTALAVGFNMFCNGFYLGYSAILIHSLRQEGSRLRVTPEQESWIASVSGFSQIIGNLLVSPVLEYLGRRRSHLISTLPLLLNWLIILLVADVNLIIVARFIGGLSMGFVCPLSPMLIGEMVDPKHRGAFLTTISLAITAGVVVCQAVASVMTWEQIAMLSLIMSFVSLILVLFTKESPSWLLSRGRVDECSEVFRWLRGADALQEQELQEMIRKQTIILHKNRSQSKSVVKRFITFTKYLSNSSRKKEFYKPLLIMFHINTMLQFSGLPTVISYTPDIIGRALGRGANVYVWMFVLNMERLLSSFIAIYLMKKLNRRTLMWCTGSVVVGSYAGLGLSVLAKDHGVFSNNWVPGVLLIAYMLAMGSGFFALTFTIPGEIFPLEYRSVGSSLSLFVGSIGLFASVKCFPGLVASIGLPLTNIIYSVITVYCLVFVFFTLPETKDRTLQEIEDKFRGEREKPDVIEPLHQLPTRHSIQLE